MIVLFVILISHLRFRRYRNHWIGPYWISDLRQLFQRRNVQRWIFRRRRRFLRRWRRFRRRRRQRRLVDGGQDVSK